MVQVLHLITLGVKDIIQLNGKGTHELNGIDSKLHFFLQTNLTNSA